MKNTFLILLTFCVAILLSGCQTTTTYYQGAKADLEGVVSLIPLQDGQQQWQDWYITVNYNLHRNDDNLDIEGTLSFSDGSRGNYTRVRDLKLKFFLLDQNMRVVDYFDIAWMLSTHLDDEATFSRTVKLKEGVIAVTYGYNGIFIDNDPERSSTQMAWRLPKRGSR